jgi:hypothetical protein
VGRPASRRPTDGAATWPGDRRIGGAATSDEGGYPLYDLIKPGQPAPFDHYPAIAGGVVLVALIWGLIAYGRDRALGDRVGSIVADAD